jgi:hypothetical protein
LLILLKSWCSFWSLKIIKVNSEAAIHKVFLLLLAVIFIFISGCGDKYKIFVLTVGYIENEQVGLTCRMCAALVYLRINKVEEGWLMIMENVPQHEKSTLFPDYFIQQ